MVSRPLWLDALLTLRELGCRQRQVLLGEAAQLFKSRRIFDRHIRQHFSIQQHIRFLQCVDEPTVGQPLSPNAGTDAGDP